MKGIDQSRFDECYAIAPTAIIHGIPIKFLHINHLIETKSKLGRPQDQVDVVELEKIRREKNR